MFTRRLLPLALILIVLVSACGSWSSTTAGSLPEDAAAVLISDEPGMADAECHVSEKLDMDDDFTCTAIADDGTTVLWNVSVAGGEVAIAPAG